MGIFEGHIRVHSGDRFALVAARWNDFIVERLIEGAKDCIIRHGGSDDQLDLIRVPGSFELPQAAKLAAICALLGKIPTVAEYLEQVSIVGKKSADIYRYMNFDQIADFRDVADTVTV
jgi:hypothetical protein